MLGTDLLQILGYLRYKYGKNFTKFQLNQLTRLLDESIFSWNYWHNELKFLKRFMDFNYYFYEIDKRITHRNNYLKTKTEQCKKIDEIVFDVLNKNNERR